MGFHNFATFTGNRSHGADMQEADVITMLFVYFFGRAEANGPVKSWNSQESMIPMDFASFGRIHGNS